LNGKIPSNGYTYVEIRRELNDHIQVYEIRTNKAAWDLSKMTQSYNSYTAYPALHNNCLSVAKS
jgi:hypothetical protein